MRDGTIGEHKHQSGAGLEARVRFAGCMIVWSAAKLAYPMVQSTGVHHAHGNLVVFFSLSESMSLLSSESVSCLITADATVASRLATVSIVSEAIGGVIADVEILRRCVRKRRKPWREAAVAPAKKALAVAAVAPAESCSH